MRAHIARVGLGVGNASTQHGSPQQVLVHLLALLGGDELHIRAHKIRGKGHCGKEGLREGPGGGQGPEGRGLGSGFLGLREEGPGSELLV